MAVQEGLSLVGYIVANKLKGGDSVITVASDTGGVSPCVQLETVYTTISEAAIVSPKEEVSASMRRPNAVLRADSKSSDDSYVAVENIYQQQDQKEWIDIDMVKLSMSDTPSDE